MRQELRKESPARFRFKPKKRLQVAILHNITPDCGTCPCPHRHVCPVPYTKVPSVYVEVNNEFHASNDSALAF